MMPPRKVTFSSPILQSILLLAGVRVSLDEIGAWSADQADQVGRWAVLSVLAATYSESQVPVRPEFLQVKEIKS